ncbi:MAG: class I SAM-dependent methyltransferase [Acidimicrobiales bacterium]
MDEPSGVGDGAEPRALLADQIDFYEADASGYQRWLDHLADDDNDEADAVAFRARRRRLAGLVDALGPWGRVLDLAAGTGRFSNLIAPHADHLTLVDSSPASLAIARERLGRGRAEVDDVVTDLFQWEPPGDAIYDTVCFVAWLHHVPPDHFARFWELVEKALAPGGRVIFDFLHEPNLDAGTPPPVPSSTYAMFHDPSRGISVRDLDGRRWTVVHQVWDPSSSKTSWRRWDGGWTCSPQRPTASTGRSHVESRTEEAQPAPDGSPHLARACGQSLSRIRPVAELSARETCMGWDRLTTRSSSGSGIVSPTAGPDVGAVRGGGPPDVVA